MIGLLCFVLAVLASPFKSKMRLEAENAVLRHQLIVLRRKLWHVQLRSLSSHDKLSLNPHPNSPDAQAASESRWCVDHDNPGRLWARVMSAVRKLRPEMHRVALIDDIFVRANSNFECSLYHIGDLFTLVRNDLQS